MKNVFFNVVSECKRVFYFGSIVFNLVLLYNVNFVWVMIVWKNKIKFIVKIKF